MKSIVNDWQEIYDHQSVQRLFRRNFAPDEPACFERFNWSSQHRWIRQRFPGRCFRGPRSGRTKLKINAWNWRDSGAGNDKSRTHFVLNGRKCCRDGRGFCKFRRGHGNDELVQRKYFRTEEKYRSFQDLIKWFQHSAFCKAFLCKRSLKQRCVHK